TEPNWKGSPRYKKIALLMDQFYRPANILAYPYPYANCPLQQWFFADKLNTGQKKAQHRLGCKNLLGKHT
ncbi:MAG: hypothetical protein ACI96W_001221, partial [Paraglaciecola sp.]